MNGTPPRSSNQKVVLIGGLIISAYGVLSLLGAVDSDRVGAVIFLGSGAGLLVVWLSERLGSRWLQLLSYALLAATLGLLLFDTIAE